MKNAYLYEARPDIVPYGFVSDLEMELWELYYEELNRK
jgi:hypothetical protein